MPRRLEIRLSLAVLLAAALAQVAFGLWAKNRHGDWGALEPPPPATTRDLMAFGDPQVLFRLSALGVQHAGDTAGRTTPLRDTDYDAAIAWLQTLDTLDPKSIVAPNFAAFYFGQTSVPEDAARMVRYLMEAAKIDPDHRWRYLVQALFIAKHRVEDTPLALRAARALADLPAKDKPVWTRQMPAFILAEMGETAQAAMLFALILKDADDLPPEEVRFMLDRLKSYQEGSIGHPSKPGDFKAPAPAPETPAPETPAR